LQYIFHRFFSGLDDFEGLGGLDRNFAAKAGVGDGKGNNFLD
jgi:hypothetical protein